MKSILNLSYGADAAQVLDIHLPECAAFPVFLYFHGGGLEFGDKSEVSAMIDYLTAHGICVVSANYRMYPTAKYPEFIQDAAAAAAWVKAQIGGYGKCEGIFIGGSSAGGYLSQMLCFDGSYLAAHGLSAMDFAGFIHDAGQPTAHYNVLRERGIDSRRVIVDDTAPLFHVGRDAQYPPMLIIVSDGDLENRYEQTILLQSTLRHFGHGDQVTLQVMHGGHCAYVGALNDQGESVFGKLAEAFIRSGT
ncbi:MAG: alpha/beta hydrolase [Ruminococcaceae bacterium]|nr:alpha/beta hydrolase [Oscillospiraceae bacterium]